jgi:hypothetical protein
MRVEYSLDSVHVEAVLEAVEQKLQKRSAV